MSIERLYSALDSMLPGTTVEEKLDRLVEYGFNGVEVSYRLAAQDPAAFRRACERRGVTIVDVTGVWLGDGLSADSEARAAQWRVHTDNVRLAAALGSRHYIVVDHIPKPADLPVNTTRPWLVDSLRRLGDIAAPLGVTLMVELLARKFNPVAATASDVRALCQDVDHPAVRLMLDSYHMAANGEDFVTAIPPAMQYCQHVHCSDYVPDVEPPANERPVPGGGSVDFMAFLQPILRAGYDGALGFEGRLTKDRPEVLARARQFIATIVAKLSAEPAAVSLV